MKESGGVYELDHNSERYVPLSFISGDPARKKKHEGPKPLAAATEDVFADLGYEVNVRGDVFPEFFFHHFEFVSHEVERLLYFQTFFSLVVIASEAKQSCFLAHMIPWAPERGNDEQVALASLKMVSQRGGGCQFFREWDILPSLYGGGLGWG